MPLKSLCRRFEAPGEREEGDRHKSWHDRRVREQADVQDTLVKVRAHTNTPRRAVRSKQDCSTKEFTAARFGVSVRVDNEFTRNEDQWQREIYVREQCKVATSNFVVSQVASLPSPEFFAEQVSGLRRRDGRSLAE